MKPKRKSDRSREEKRAARLKPGFVSRLSASALSEAEISVADVRPAVLLNKDLNLMVSWSAKSACTSIYVWFAHASGFGDEISELSNWPHDHRKMIYEKSELRHSALMQDFSEYVFLKVIRDPFDRAVSMYRHALACGICDPLFDRHQRRPAVNSLTGYSFLQYLELLESIDLWNVDVHLRPQFHPVERRSVPKFVINLSKQDLFAELNVFEDRFGLRKTDFTAMEWLHVMEGKRKAAQEDQAGGNFEDTPITKHDVAAKKFPSYSQLLSPRTRRKIEQIYAIDFVSYRDNL
ncbi:sulfotransferase family 2 domain-containing protein [Aestuariivirga sp.]|uniref:sulfotransferase family 2 domain-containing protein n=1 Tax=Aestuariivirga sp. TaxID=2650926 RepID=UPI0039E2B43C